MGAPQSSELTMFHLGGKVGGCFGRSRGTRISSEGAASLAAALPGCEIIDPQGRPVAKPAVKAEEAAVNPPSPNPVRDAAARPEQK